MSNLSSKRVHVETVEYYRIDLPAGYTAADVILAARELNLFRSDYYEGDDTLAPDPNDVLAGIEQIVNGDGSLTLRFENFYSSQGQDLNPLVFKDIVLVETILAREDAAVGAGVI